MSEKETEQKEKDVIEVQLSELVDSHKRFEAFIALPQPTTLKKWELFSCYAKNVKPEVETYKALFQSLAKQYGVESDFQEIKGESAEDRNARLEKRQANLMAFQSEIDKLGEKTVELPIAKINGLEFAKFIDEYNAEQKRNARQRLPALPTVTLRSEMMIDWLFE